MFSSDTNYMALFYTISPSLGLQWFISNTTQCRPHRFKGSVPQNCPHFRGQPPVGDPGYPYFCPADSKFESSQAPLLRFGNS